MAESIDRYLRMMPGARVLRTAGRLWYPSADVYQTQDGWIVKVELAGICSDELEVKTEGNTLHLSGCRRDTFYAESVSYQQLEITWSRFEKTIQFPCPIEGTSMKMDYRDGILVLHLKSSTDCEE